MSLIKILDSDFKLQAILRDVLDCTRYEQLNGENTVSFSCVLDEKAQYINDNAIVELDNDYFDVVYYQKKQNEDGTMTVEVEAEHVSYRLNNPEYNKDYFTEIGTPTQVLTAILQGTGFSVGTVEFTDSITYSAQEAKSRRQILMEFIALLGGEAVFDKFTINILQHRGQTEPQIYTTGKNVKVISKIFDKRQKDKNGNPLVSYVCEPLNLPNRSAGLGDEILLIHNEIGVKETLRIVSVAYNPYDPLICELQIANFVSGLEDQLYRIETSTVAKGKIYNGCKISADEGFEAVRSDNKAKTVLNATEGISIYSDLGSGLVKNFFVDTDGRIKAKSIDIDGSGTFSGTISANQISGGYISADRISGGTLSGITLNIDTDAVVGDSIRLGSTSSNITLSKASGGFYLSSNINKLLKFYSSALWVDGDIAIPEGCSLGYYTNGIDSSYWYSLIDFYSAYISIKEDIRMNNYDIVNVKSLYSDTGRNLSIYGGANAGVSVTGSFITIKANGSSQLLHLDASGTYSNGIKMTGKIGFFDKTPVAKTAITNITTSATPEQVRSKLIELITAMQSYGLV